MASMFILFMYFSEHLKDVRTIQFAPAEYIYTSGIKPNQKTSHVLITLVRRLVF